MINPLSPPRRRMEKYLRPPTLVHVYPMIPHGPTWHQVGSNDLHVPRPHYPTPTLRVLPPRPSLVLNRLVAVLCDHHSAGPRTLDLPPPLEGRRYAYPALLQPRSATPSNHRSNNFSQIS